MKMSRILVIGGTGNIGHHLVMASLDAGHPTAVLVRPSTTVAFNSEKAKLLDSLKARGASIVNVRFYIANVTIMLKITAKLHVHIIIVRLYIENCIVLHYSCRGT
jgi:nucleoside-diphosphate-sugar epimerase